MYFHQFGRQLRKARQGAGLTQEDLAQAAGVSRVTVNQIENGVFPDLGCRKLLALLAVVGLDLAVTPKERKEKDYLKLACISANVSHRESLSPDELAHTLLTGKAQASRRSHLRVVFDEVPESVFEGMLSQVEQWVPPGRVRKNAQNLAAQLDSRRSRSA
ncbi:MAG: helix-turn-helix transcriptional regulator [Rhodocyclaceae bacterium]|nr:helix-turn-helix transcriptional regulator [Rhodocyclaceae bacterium]